MNYSSERRYEFWSYTVSHNVLLIRSMKFDLLAIKHSEQEEFTIDIQFIGVTFLDIPAFFHGITIHLLNRDECPLHIRNSLIENGRLFEIVSQGEKYYIAASAWVVCKGKMESHENVLDNPFLKYDETIYYQKNT